MYQVHEMKESYLVSWVAWGNTIDVRFDNIPDAVKFAGYIADKYGVCTHIKVETVDFVSWGGK